jgi:hypothetical protein
LLPELIEIRRSRLLLTASRSEAQTLLSWTAISKGQSCRRCSSNRKKCLPRFTWPLGKQTNDEIDPDRVGVMRREELQRAQERGEGRVVPMYLSTFDDDWKT